MSSALTPREIAVAALLSYGLTNADIARCLGCTQHTLDHHIGALIEKLGVWDRTAVAVRWCRDWQYLLMEARMWPTGGPRPRVRGMTPRQTEVARLVAGGMRNKAAAAALGVSVNTIEDHLHRIYEKLGIRKRAQLRAMWRE